MTILQVIAAVIFIGMVLYFLYDVIVHAIQRGGKAANHHQSPYLDFDICDSRCHQYTNQCRLALW